MADGQVLSHPRVVLVVDDEPIALQMMARALLEAGYAVRTASNGPDALALAEDLPRPPDLVVTDILMEPMGGTELAERLFRRPCIALPVREWLRTSRRLQ
jgi:CheY-like chemotaxis protein